MRLIRQQIGQMIDNAGNAIRHVFRGKINLTKSADKIQKVQVSALADETLQDVELMQHFGFTSHPPASTEALIIPIGGKTSHSVVVATENGQFRVKALKSGEVAIYDQSGSSIVLKQGKVIEINCATLNIIAPKINIKGNISQQGSINNDGDMVASGVSLTKHTHRGDSGGRTSLPS